MLFFVIFAVLIDREYKVMNFVLLVRVKIVLKLLIINIVRLVMVK